MKKNAYLVLILILSLFISLEDIYGAPLNQIAYHSYESLVADLNRLASDHPDIAKVYALGTTEEGRLILAVKISDNAASDIDEYENKVLFIGMHHAREWISLEVPYLLAKYLVEHYNDPSIKPLIDNEEIWIIPLLNPDGFEYSRSSNRLWRKNRRHFPRPFWFDCYGVDLNRNYGSSTWGTIKDSANSYKCDDDTYIGPNAFSERETQVIRDLFRTYHFDAVLSYHSYSQLILWPWGYTTEPISNTADKRFMENLANAMRDRIQGVHGEIYIPQQSSKLYRTAGDLTDWSYETFGIPSFTIELRPKSAFPPARGFLLPEDQIDETFEENLPAALLLLEAFKPIIESPTTSNPANAGPYNSPHKIFITVSGIGKGRKASDFKVRIGGLQGTVVSAVRTDVNRYILGVIPPVQASNGVYDLEVIIGGASAKQNRAVNYSDTLNADVVLVLDRSGSMGYSGYLEPAKSAAKQFVDFMQIGDKVGVVSFDDISYINFPLTTIVSGGPPVFTDNMESGGGNWVADSPWTLTTEKAHSPNHAWSDSPGGSYSNNADVSLTLNTPLNLAGIPNPTLTFWSWLDLETGWDYAYVEVSTDGGATWTIVASYTGHETRWTEKSVSLTAYSDQTALRLRFRLRTDSSVVYDGWYIDDVQIGPADTRQQAKLAIDGITEGGTTSIGSGLQTAQAQLLNNGDPLHSWAIVLLSDGYENTPPWVADILPAIVASKTVVHTIALGPDSDQNLLLDIASQTGGTYSYAPDASALSSIYNIIIGQVSGQQTLFLESGAIQQGQIEEKSLTLDIGLFEATFSVIWSEPNVINIALTLRQPDGRLIDPTVAANDPNIDFYAGSTFQYYRIRGPMAGIWTMRIYGASISLKDATAAAAQSYTALVTGHTDTTLNFYLDQSAYQIGEHILLSAVLADQQPIRGAEITVLATAPASAVEPIKPLQEWIQIRRDSKPTHSSISATITQTITLYDDGLHNDGASDDGIYANIFTNTVAAGIYTFDLKATGVSNSGSPFTRLASAAVNVIAPPVPKVDVTSSSPITARPGDVLSLSFGVRNTGDQSASFELRVGELETQLGWGDTSLIPEAVYLYPGEIISYPVRVTVPITAPGGSSFSLHLIAVSQTDPDVSDVAVIHVEIPLYRMYLPLLLKAK